MVTVRCQQNLEVYALVGAMALVVGTIGASALLCFKEANENLSFLVSENEEKSCEKKNQDSFSQKKVK